MYAFVIGKKDGKIVSCGFLEKMAGKFTIGTDIRWILNKKKAELQEDFNNFLSVCPKARDTEFSMECRDSVRWNDRIVYRIVEEINKQQDQFVFEIYGKDDGVNVHFKLFYKIRTESSALKIQLGNFCVVSRIDSLVLIDLDRNEEEPIEEDELYMTAVSFKQDEKAMDIYIFDSFVSVAGHNQSALEMFDTFAKKNTADAIQFANMFLETKKHD